MTRAQSLWKRLVTPRAADEDEARQEHMTRVVLAMIGGSLAVVTVPVLASYMMAIFDVDALIGVFLSGVYIAISWGLTLGGRWRLASWIPPLMLFQVGVLGSFMNGLWTPLVLAYALAVVLAALLLGIRAQWLTVGMSVLVHLLVGQVLHPRPVDDLLSTAVVVSAILASLALLQWFALSLLHRALAETRDRNTRLQSEMAKRQRAEGDLRRLNAELEQRVKARTLELSQLNAELSREVVERQRAESVLQAALHEKEVLLKEIHHRVKNNLQIISSLLSLQARQVTDAPTQQALRESQTRVRSMALIHEKLYQSQGLARIDFGEYVRSLAADLVRSYQRGPGQIQFSVQADEVALDLDHAVPSGLILNELMTNVLKYAFPDGRQGTLRVELRATPEKRLSLRVADDGVGLPADLDILNTKSLGLQLVHSLVAQVDGRLEVDRSQGTAFRVSFEY